MAGDRTLGPSGPIRPDGVLSFGTGPKPVLILVRDQPINDLMRCGPSARAPVGNKNVYRPAFFREAFSFLILGLWS